LAVFQFSLKGQTLKTLALAFGLMFAVVSIAPAAEKGTGSKPASKSVRGYTKKDGTHVDAHRRTTPDKSKTNNYGAKGNMKPSGKGKK